MSIRELTTALQEAKGSVQGPTVANNVLPGTQTAAPRGKKITRSHIRPASLHYEHSSLDVCAHRKLSLTTHTCTEPHHHISFTKLTKNLIATNLNTQTCISMGAHNSWSVIMAEALPEVSCPPRRMMACLGSAADLTRLIFFSCVCFSCCASSKPTNARPFVFRPA